MHCPKCDRLIPDCASECIFCGLTFSKKRVKSLAKKLKGTLAPTGASPLTLRCPKCDRAMPDNAIACVFCGAPFVADAAAKIPVPVPVPAPAQQLAGPGGMLKIYTRGWVLAVAGVLAALVLVTLYYRTPLDLLILERNGNRQVNEITGDAIVFPRTWQKANYKQFSGGDETSAHYARAKAHYDQGMLAAQITTENNDYRLLTVNDITNTCQRESLTLDQYFQRSLAATGRHYALTGIGNLTGRAGNIRWLKAVRKSPAPLKAVEKLYFVERGSRKFLLYSLTSSQNQFTRYEHELDLIALSFTPQPAKPSEDD